MPLGHVALSTGSDAHCSTSNRCAGHHCGQTAFLSARSRSQPSCCREWNARALFRHTTQRQTRSARCQVSLTGSMDEVAPSASQDELATLKDLESEILRPPPVLSTMEESEQFEELKVVREEVVVEDRGELVFLLVGAAVAFGAGIWGTLGGAKAAEYYAGYLLEQALSVDNLFVFILVFRYFQTPRVDQEKVLTWGILTAAVLRLVMILLGVELIDHFKPVLLGFAAVLLFSAYKLLAVSDGDDNEDMSDNFVVKLCRRFIPVSQNYDSGNFFTIENGVRVATPLLLVLAIVELSDVVFAVDSIPAVFGVTLDPFIIYTSNIFAILSLRALYSFVATVMSELKYLDKAVALVLGFIGVKMVVEFGGLHLPTEASLGIVASLLGGGVAASLLLPDAVEEQ